MKKLILTKKQLNESILGKKEIFNIYVFVSHMKKYIEQLLKDPIHARPDDVILSNMKDIDIIKTLLDNKIVSRKERIFTDVDKDRFGITYKCEDHWMNKLKKLFSELFSENTSSRSIIECEGCDGGLGGATGADICGNMNTPIAPLGKPMRKKIYPGIGTLSKDETVYNHRHMIKGPLDKKKKTKKR